MQSVFYRKLSKGCRIFFGFFGSASPEFKKWVNSRPVQLYKSENQVLNFVECAISRKPTISPAEVGARGAVLCQLCNMSYVYDTGFDWDPDKMEFANGTGKGIALKRDYCRNGWEVVV